MQPCRKLLMSASTKALLEKLLNSYSRINSHKGVYCKGLLRSGLPTEGAAPDWVFTFTAITFVGKVAVTACPVVILGNWPAFFWSLFEQGCSGDSGLSLMLELEDEERKGHLSEKWMLAPQCRHGHP